MANGAQESGAGSDFIHLGGGAALRAENHPKLEERRPANDNAMTCRKSA